MNKKDKMSTWTGKGSNNEWNNPENWDIQEVPTGIALFSKSAQTKLTFSTEETAEIQSIEFAADAPSYTIICGDSPNIPELTISGKGVMNSSSCAQNFIVASPGQYYKNPQLKFAKNASAGGRNNIYSSGPESLEEGYGGGIIGFVDNATAGSATFIVRTGAIAPPSQGSTVGGEVAFCDNSNAGYSNFTIYGTLGSDGDTFGNTVFHDQTSADHAMFTNIGGTVSGGDGGNTQFYNFSSAAHGSFYNFGGSVAKANGGDVAFDGNADGGYGTFHNLQATAAGAFGGVTSFNNNPPYMDSVGASAGYAFLHNYGAREASDGGGGHTEFTAKYGSATGGNATFINYGSAISGKSNAGHTIFSINLPNQYYPSAGNGTYINHPALAKGGSSGYTAFAVYGEGEPSSIVPTAENGTFINLGSNLPGTYGGYTSFSGNSTAGNSLLLAMGGTNGGYGGSVSFYDQSDGAAAVVELYSNGELDISGHAGGLSLGQLKLNEGILRMKLGNALTSISLKGKMTMTSENTTFLFVTDDSVHFNQAYPLITAQNMSDFWADRFKGNSFNGVNPRFFIKEQTLFVIFEKD